MQNYKTIEILSHQVKFLEEELEKARYIKIDLENRSKKLDHILAGLVHFAKEKRSLRYEESVASTSKTKPVPIQMDNKKKKNLEKKKKPVRQQQAIQTPHVSPS